MGEALGLTIGAVSTGGASDANVIATLSVPVLDGLGPIGGGMHAPDEHLDLASLPDRVALVAGAILERPPRAERGTGPAAPRGAPPDGWA